MPGWEKIVNKNNWSGAEVLIVYPLIIDAEIIGFSLIYNDHFKDIESKDLIYFDSIVNNYVQDMKFLKVFNNLFDECTCRLIKLISLYCGVERYSKFCKTAKAAKHN